MKKVFSLILAVTMLFGAAAMVSAQDKTYLERAYDGEFKGKIVTLDGPFIDNDQVLFEASIKDFEEKTGIDIQYIGNKDFESTIQMRVEGGNAPDIADFPQPGGMANLAKKGYIVDVRDFISEDWLKENYSQAWLDLATVPNEKGEMIMGGIWARNNAKSQVYYRPKVWEEAGYETPETWQEMVDLSKQMVADGETPWCLGIEGGAGTGWPATDWVENIMLRTTSLENYKKWTTGELKFDSPEVRRALEIMSEIFFTDGFVYGGREAIATTNFGEAVKPLFYDTNGCMMYSLGNFITAYFPKDAVPGVDYDVFYLPPIDEQYGRPFLGAGDVYSVFKGHDRDEVKATLEFFTHGESLKVWLANGGAMFPGKDADPSWYANATDAKISQMINDATSFSFDGSDQMPAAVGSGTFWKGMVDLVTGTDIDTVVKNIDKGWEQ